MQSITIRMADGRTVTGTRATVEIVSDWDEPMGQYWAGTAYVQGEGLRFVSGWGRHGNAPMEFRDDTDRPGLYR
jgi:hypothetical protein